MLLAIEARIGELTKGVPKTPHRGGGAGSGKRALPSGKPLKHERLGLKEQQMKTAQTIANHPEAVAAVVKEAEENDDIPTKWRC